MESVQSRPPRAEKPKTYVFLVVVEPDYYDSGEEAWMAYCPNISGTTTFGKTKEEALRNVHEVVQMAVETMIEDGEQIPVEPVEGGGVVKSTVVVTV